MLIPLGNMITVCAIRKERRSPTGSLMGAVKQFKVKHIVYMSAEPTVVHSCVYFHPSQLPAETRLSSDL